MTPYEKRLAIATNAVLDHYYGGHTRAEARELAAAVLNAVDTIPEKLR